MNQTTTRWKSRTSFIFAASAAAIGLGNIWRFPYLTGENGGGAFVLIYLGFVIVLGIPLLISEMTLGRIGRFNPAKAMASVSEKSKHSRLWGMVGGISIIAAYLILSYYVVIIGWVLDYFVRAISGQFAHATEANSLSCFAKLQANHWRMLLTDTLVVLGTIGVIFFGVKRGLERAVMVMFPSNTARSQAISSLSWSITSIVLMTPFLGTTARTGLPNASPATYIDAVVMSPIVIHPVSKGSGRMRTSDLIQSILKPMMYSGGVCSPHLVTCD